ncbi:hypothetical protein ABTZ78_17180 [Streptomyces bauhiniae]
MNPEQTPVGEESGTEEGWPDVYGDAPPIDDRQLSTRPTPDDA